MARAAVPLETIDVTSAAQVEAVLEDCTHVVNCTRGGSDVMLQGLKNLLAASRKRKIRRFVHLSSVAVYGDPPPPESTSEEAVAAPPPGSYGAEKLEQDNMVAAACAAGLDCVVLCPPNISGLYSSFVSNVLSDIRNCRLRSLTVEADRSTLSMSTISATQSGLRLMSGRVMVGASLFPTATIFRGGSR